MTITASDVLSEVSHGWRMPAVRFRAASTIRARTGYTDVMAIHRRATGTWSGDLKTGNGSFSTQSGALKDVPFSFGTRFGDTPGTNPEELIAAAHAGCYSMALTAYLGSQGVASNAIETKALCVLEQIEGGFKIAEMRLSVTGDVPGVDEARFKELAAAAEKTCPVSNALRGSVAISVEAVLR